MKRENMRRFLLLTFLVGLFLIIDELWMFGLPFGHILPDLSEWHISPFHHYMLGIAMVTTSYWFYRRERL